MKKNPENLSKIIIPKKDDDKNQELLENLEAISDDDIMKMGEGFEKARKGVNNPENENKEENVNEEEDVEDIEDFEIVCNLEGSNIEYSKSKGIVKWKGKKYDVNDFRGAKEFVDDTLYLADEEHKEQLIKIWTTIGI